MPPASSDVAATNNALHVRCFWALAARNGETPSYWTTVQDLVVIKAIKALREAGCSLQTVAELQGTLAEKWNAGLSSSVLLYNGKDVMVVDDGTVISLIQEKGQTLFTETLTIITLPLNAWIDEGTRNSALVDIRLIRATRKRIQDGRPTA